MAAATCWAGQPAKAVAAGVGFTGLVPDRGSASSAQAAGDIVTFAEHALLPVPQALERSQVTVRRNGTAVANHGLLELGGRGLAVAVRAEPGRQAFELCGAGRGCVTYEVTRIR